MHCVSGTDDLQTLFTWHSFAQAHRSLLPELQSHLYTSPRTAHNRWVHDACDGSRKSIVDGVIVGNGPCADVGDTTCLNLSLQEADVPIVVVACSTSSRRYQHSLR